MISDDSKDPLDPLSIEDGVYRILNNSKDLQRPSNPHRTYTEKKRCHTEYFCNEFEILKKVS
jgi:hypothetical protein